MVRSAKAVMADRSLALGALQQARADVDAKRTKLAKLRGTPGIKVGLPFLAPLSLIGMLQWLRSCRWPDPPANFSRTPRWYLWNVVQQAIILPVGA